MSTSESIKKQDTAQDIVPPEVRAAMVLAFELAADVATSHKLAARRINLFGNLSEAYGADEAMIRDLARKVKAGEEIRDRNGLVVELPSVAGV